MPYAKRLSVKAGWTFFFVAFLLVFSSSPAMACTSFAVYSQEPIYGMNFDWFYDTELKFMVLNESRYGDNFEFFSLVFDIEGNDGYSPIMSNGLFYSIQEQRPAGAGKDIFSELAEDELFISQVVSEAILMQLLNPNIDVPGVIDNIQMKKFVQLTNQGCHILAADPQGNAAILEVGKEENEILPIAGDFIVMTNFPNSLFKGLPYNMVYGTGADRYIKAYEYIDQHLDSFDIDHAFEALKQTTQDFTLCSLVCDPLRSNIYFALNRDFEKIWKISLHEKTIETYRGFEKEVKLPIPEEGITATDLLAIDTSSKTADRSGLYWKIGIIAGAIVILTVIIILVAPKLIWKLKLRRWRRM